MYILFYVLAYSILYNSPHNCHFSLLSSSHNFLIVKLIIVFFLRDIPSIHIVQFQAMTNLLLIKHCMTLLCFSTVLHEKTKCIPFITWFSLAKVKYLVVNFILHTQYVSQNKVELFFISRLIHVGMSTCQASMNTCSLHSKCNFQKQWPWSSTLLVKGMICID